MQLKNEIDQQKEGHIDNVDLKKKTDEEWKAEKQ